MSFIDGTYVRLRLDRKVNYFTPLKLIKYFVVNKLWLHVETILDVPFSTFSSIFYISIPSVNIVHSYKVQS